MTHNNQEVIGRCLDATRRSAEHYSTELFIVDNASTDRTVERAVVAAPEAHVIRLGENVGFAVANNVAIATASGRFIALVNADAFPDRGAIDRLVRRAECGRIGIVGGRLRYPSGRHQPSAGAFPSVARNLGIALFFHRLPLTSRLHLSILASQAHYATAHRVDWASAAFCVAKREVGPLPTSGFMYGEDVEWARRALARGFETWIEPSGTAVHLRGGGIETGHAAERRQLARLEFDLRWFGPRATSLLAARIVVSIHATTRIVLHTLAFPVRPAAARRGIIEYLALLRAALSTSGPEKPEPLEEG